MIISMFFSVLPSFLSHIMILYTKYEYCLCVPSLLSDHVQVIAGLLPATAAHGTNVSEDEYKGFNMPILDCNC